MTLFSVLLIENALSTTERVLAAVGNCLDSFRLSVCFSVRMALREQEPADAILVSIDQLSSDISGKLAALREIYPHAQITILAAQDDDSLLEALSAGADGYVLLSAAGLVMLGRQLAAQATPPEPTVSTDPEMNSFLNNVLASDESQLAVQVIAPDDRVLLWNRATTGIFGLSAAEVVGRPITALSLSPQNLGRLKDLLDQVRVTSEPFIIPNYPLETQSGQTQWVQVYIYPVRDPKKPDTLNTCIIMGDTTDLTQAELENKRHNQELQLLLEFSRDVSEQLDLTSTLEKITERVRTLLWADRCLIYFVERDNETLKPALDIFAEKNGQAAHTLSVGEGVIGTLATGHHAKAFVAADPAEIPGYTRDHDQPLQILGAPITALKGNIGVILVTRLHTPFDEDEVRFFEGLVQHASSAINNARFFEGTQRNLHELAILHEASVAIANTLNTQSVLDTLIQQIVQVIDVSGGQIIGWNNDQQRGTIRARYTQRDASDEAQMIDPAFALNLAARPTLSIVIKQQRPAFFQLSTPSLDQAERASMEARGHLSRLLVPLVVKGQTIGWTELWETRREIDFTVEEVRLARMLSNQAAVALERDQYLRRMQQNLDETMALYEVANALTLHQDAQDIMVIVLAEYLRAINAQQGSIVVFDFGTRVGIIKAHHSESHSSSRLEGREIPLTNNPVYTRLMRTRQPVIIEDVQATHEEEAARASVHRQRSGVRDWVGPNALSMLVVPIQLRNEIVGVIVAEATHEKRLFGRRDTSLGQGMANQLSIALQNSRLYQAESERRQQAETLREVSFIVGSSIHLMDVLERILEQLRRVVNYDSAAIHLIESRRRRIIAGRGFPHPEQVIGLSFPLGLNEQEPGSVVIHRRRPMIINDTSKYPGAFDGIHEHIESWMGVPFIARDKVIGVMTIDRTERGGFNKEDTKLTMAFANQVAIALENARLYEIEVKQIEYELEIANQIQETLLPQSMPQMPGLQIYGRTIPARQIGGDFFHFFQINDDQLCIAIGDVSGKGIPAALYMAVATTAIDAQVEDNPRPGDLLNKLNEVLYSRLQENKMNIGLQVATFTTLPTLEDGDNKRNIVSMTVASAGMIAPIGATPYGSRYLPVSGLPIGVLPADDQQYRGDEFLLDSATTMVFTSDGIVEAQNENHELFGFERLEATINEAVRQSKDAETVANYIINEAQTFMGDAEQSDDMTVLVVIKE